MITAMYNSGWLHWIYLLLILSTYKHLFSPIAKYDTYCDCCVVIFTMFYITIVQYENISSSVQRG